MADYQDVFKRTEKKYRLQGSQFQEVLNILEDRMARDEYGMHTINNLYFDTDDYEIIRESIDKPLYKEKLRLRSYGTPGSLDKVHIELKKKFKGIVYKRRFSLPYIKAQKYLLQGEKPEVQSQIQSEIDWFISRYQPSPKAFIAYERLAFSGLLDPNFRITFDQNVRYRLTALDLSKGTFGEPLFNPGIVLMEIKMTDAMPLWLSHALTDLSIFPTSVSKYGTCYQTYIQPKIHLEQKGGIKYA